MSTETPPVTQRELDLFRESVEKQHKGMVVVLEDFRADTRRMREAFARVEKKQERCERSQRVQRLRLVKVGTKLKLLDKVSTQLSDIAKSQEEIPRLRSLMWMTGVAVGCLALAWRPEIFWGLIRIFGGAH